MKRDFEGLMMPIPRETRWGMRANALILMGFGIVHVLMSRKIGLSAVSLFLAGAGLLTYSVQIDRKQ